jgi:ankyrin repeat protein
MNEPTSSEKIHPLLYLMPPEQSQRSTYLPTSSEVVATLPSKVQDNPTLSIESAITTLSSPNSMAHTVLHFALENGHTEVAKMLAEKDADVNTKTGMFFCQIFWSTSVLSST